ncbi:hypothetical protein [Duganella callida]|uniref:Uncharacterized protein n=1 Tax=Duganella callida TaxID=2561932 RepID=A0A4Y9SIH6_9BURK|nr:hypothetical protein [Duganella callida]TFW20621.1 hypothetical protein E4L98_14115 [Duganella callida]
MSDQSAFRRSNLTMAEQVQYGITLMYVAGRLPAQRYMLRCGVPGEVIERVLEPPYKRRVYGEHGSADPAATP